MTALSYALSYALSCGRPSPTWREPLTGIEMVLAPSGVFVMGSAPGEAGREPIETPHEVRISRPFYIARHEVTQAQWHRVLGTRPSWFGDCGDRCPVERVSFHDAQRFAARLSAMTGERFRLPTEAEWEYACRAGTSTPFHTGETLTTAQANYDGRAPSAGFPPGEFRGRPTPVGSFPANAWGLFDIHGNVWEWVDDWHCPYPPGPVTDPRGRCATEHRVLRGGSWYFDAANARCALRNTHRPQDSGFSIGFRLVRELPSPEPGR